MLARYREGMTPEELDASLAREAEAQAAMQARTEERIVPVFLPSYDPEHNPAPVHFAEVLAKYPLEDG
jgi:hypothetical protein